jgi:hypothetical protein
MVFLTNLPVGGNPVLPRPPTHDEIGTPADLANSLGVVSAIEPSHSDMKTPVTVAAPSITSATSSPSILLFA